MALCGIKIKYCRHWTRFGRLNILNPSLVCRSASKQDFLDLPNEEFFTVHPVPFLNSHKAQYTGSAVKWIDAGHCGIQWLPWSSAGMAGWGGNLVQFLR